jgi:hypothetical protein
VWPAAQDAAQIHAAGAAIAAGHVVALDGRIAHDALVHGFGWVMLYGGVGAWLLAAASFVTFGVTNPTRSKLLEARATTSAQRTD